jgi:hypothetical protein
MDLMAIVLGVSVCLQNRVRGREAPKPRLQFISDGQAGGKESLCGFFHAETQRRSIFIPLAQARGVYELFRLNCFIVVILHYLLKIYFIPVAKEAG